MNNTTLKLTTKFSLFALGAALLSSAGAATVTSHTPAASIRAVANFGKATSISLVTYDVTAGDKVFLALCVEPAVTMDKDKMGSYSNGSDFSLFDGNDKVARLYSGFYSGITGTSAAEKTDSQAFQIALWEVYKDDASLTANTGALYFDWTKNNTAGKAILDRAVDMVKYAKDEKIAITTRYDFTQFTATGSQTVVMAAPVPEPATYAMLGLGLGLVGFVARRRNKR